MKIMLVGGGSGGHLTPLLAVAEELKQLEPKAKLSYVGHRSDDLHAVVGENKVIAKTHRIFAGKLRRYHRAGWKQLTDVSTLLKNIRDAFYLLLGLLQSLGILRREKPDVIFIKGGFVGVPVGWAARFWHIPYVTHDSDALPGLANRLLAKKAHTHAVALPKKLYRYPANKTVEVGVPISKQYTFITKELKLEAKRALKVPPKSKVLFISGGGLGAQRINDAIVSAAMDLFKGVPELFILHQAGQKNEESVKRAYGQVLTSEQLKSVEVFGFTDKMATLSAAADVVITRAGATAMAELALQGKAVIMVPSPFFTGGHQLKNAEVYESAKAALLVPENRFQDLAPTVTELLLDPARQTDLGERLSMFAKPDAANNTAELILKVARR